VTVAADILPTYRARVREPDRSGHAERDGVRVYWELHGDGEQTVFLLNTWPTAHSRMWKQQVPYLARQFRVLTVDARGNGLSDRPAEPRAYAAQEHALDVLAVMDESDTERATVVSIGASTIPHLLFAAQHPERNEGAILSGPFYPAGEPFAEWMTNAFNERRDRYEGAQLYSRHAIAEDYPRFVEFWLKRAFVEPHCTRCVEFGLEQSAETSPDVVVAAADAGGLEQADCLADVIAPERLRSLGRAVRCPVLVVVGDSDWHTPPHWSRALADDTGGRLLTFEGLGHGLPGRWPVRFNLAVRDFVDGLRPRSEAAAAHRRNGRPRALFVSSPIGLGHAQRDVAIARELRTLVPGLEIDWLAQDPVTRVLERSGERIHPASGALASESAHFVRESGEHELHCFHAFRRMDEILCANYMLFRDVVRSQQYDVWIGDEAWEVDHHLHENPSEKTAPFVWLTDFVGWLPVDGDESERELAADYNAEMVGHIAANPELRDRALFIGEPDDIVPEPLGPDLPGIRDWTEAHFDFAGYVLPFDPDELGDRRALRRELRLDPDRPLIVASVGGSGVGLGLLRLIAEGFRMLREEAPDAHMLLVCGPRIDPELIEPVEGMEVRGYVHDLFRTLACCDLGVVQGGLSTTMELASTGRPFLYFPLRRHCEQSIHVDHRLRRHGAGRRMDFDTSTPESVAAAMGAELGREVGYRPVADGGARRAAERIAELLA
jgi:pimeloyl-ACP methyl ester carboxylesterase/predicted glycosyltransferase